MMFETRISVMLDLQRGASKRVVFRLHARSTSQHVERRLRTSQLDAEHTVKSQRRHQSVLLQRKHFASTAAACKLLL